MGANCSGAGPPCRSENSRSSESAGGRRFEPGPELLERVVDGEPVRALAREIGVAHSTLLRSLQRPEVEEKLRAIKRRRSAERGEGRRLLKDVRRRAREQAARDRQLAGAQRKPAPLRRSDYEEWLDERERPRGLSSTERMSINDELAAQVVAAGGGIQELIEATGLRTLRNVCVLINPQIVVSADANDRRRKNQPATGNGFEPTPELIRRRAAGESLRSLAEDSGRSYSTLSRAFARPWVAQLVQAEERRLLLEQERQAVEDAKHVIVAAQYTSEIKHVCCPVHNRRIYVRGVETSGSEARLEVAVCCPEAESELRQWLEVHRPVPRPDAVPPMKP